jgi:hypothetical protein
MLDKIFARFSFSVYLSTNCRHKQYQEELWTERPDKEYIDISNCPDGWKQIAIDGLNEWNAKSGVTLFEVVSQKYTATDKTALTILYEVNGDTHIGNGDGRTILSGGIVNNRPVSFDIYYNIGSGMNSMQVGWIGKHEPFRVQYGARTGQNDMSLRPETVGFIGRPSDPNLGQITDDDSKISFIMYYIPAGIRMNNYK